MKQTINTNGIPIALSLNYPGENPKGSKHNVLLKTRLFRISCLSIIVAMAISVIAKLLVWLINLITNISFYGTFAATFHSPAGNHLGLWVIVIPAIGGIIVGLMAYYG